MKNCNGKREKAPENVSDYYTNLSKSIKYLKLNHSKTLNLHLIKIVKSKAIYSIMTSQEIRQKFLDYFKSKEHLIVPSAPIVLKDDPTLMFSNSGMTQFKDYFWLQRT
jgi:hypothetical protein